MAVKKATTTKAAAKKTAAKKPATTRKTAAKKTTTTSRRGPSGPQVGEPAEGTINPAHGMQVAPGASVEDLAKLSVAGKLGTGRDRDDALRQAGADPAAVQKAAAKVRSDAKPARTSLPIPNNRKGSTVRTW